MGALLALALVTACHAAPASSAPPTTAGVAAPADPFSALDLGFEYDPASRGWQLDRSDYPATIDDTHAFEGARSLMLVHDGVHTRGRVRTSLPIEAVRGRQVRVRVRVRTEGVSRGGVGVLLSAERGLDTLARRQTPAPAQVRGTSEWTAVELALDVPTAAQDVRLVLEHSGNGTAWFDAVELELADVPPPLSPALAEGTVRDEAGAPVAGATVVFFTMSGEHSTLTTDATGHFALETAAGPHTAGVSGEAGVASTMVELAAGSNPLLDLRVSRGSLPIQGRVHDEHGAPFAGALAVVLTADERIYPAITDAEGRFSLALPPSVPALIVLEGPAGQRVMQPIEDPAAEVSAVLPRGGGASEAAIEWIRRHHIPLRTTEPRSGIEDLAGLDAAVAKATVVGLGEATHGTREFFQLKHRMLEYLVERHGFTVFGIEASRTECRAIDRYIQTGEGDPKEALEGIYFWTWNTEEVLDLIEWMRHYNATHRTALHFVGFDMQSPEVAARNVTAYLDELVPHVPEREAIASFGRPWNEEAFAELSPGAREALDVALTRLAARFDEHRAAWIEATSAEAFANALEDLVQVRQVLTMRSASELESFSVRDRAMADNVLHIAARYGKDTKAVLWAHNGHVARAWSQIDVMGKHLGQALGERYVSVGFAFDRGGFQALAIAGEQMDGLREHQVGSAGKDDIEAALRDGGPSLFALPLRELPATGAAAQWLRAPRPMRQIGAAFDKDDLSARVIEPVPDRFDVLMFVEETTRARPIRRD